MALAAPKWYSYFLEAFLSTALRLEEQIYTEVCDSLQVFLYILGGNRGENWTTCIAWCGTPLFGRVPKIIWITMPKQKRCDTFLQEQEPVAIVAGPGNREAGF